MALQASSSDDDDDDDISMSFTIDTSIVDLLPDMKLSADDLNLIFNHVVLPVQLPMQGDAQPSHVETLLLSFTIGALESYLALVDPDTRSQWAPLQRMLTGLYKSRNNLELNTSKLSAQLHQLEKNSRQKPAPIGQTLSDLAFRFPRCLRPSTECRTVSLPTR